MNISDIREKLKAQGREEASRSKQKRRPSSFVEPSRPSRLSAAIALYKSGPIFRAALDLAFVGSLLLMFSGGAAPFTNLGRVMTDAFHKITASFSQTGANPHTSNFRLGNIALGTLYATPGVDDLQLSQSISEDFLTKVQMALDRYDFVVAMRAVDAADQNDPVVQAARAVVLLNEQTVDGLMASLQYLRQSADHVFNPAFGLIGRVELMEIRLVEENKLSRDDLRTVDASGALRPVRLEDLRQEALSWFERGAAVQDPVSIRALGVAQAQGWYGQPNSQAAIAHFREAMSLDDAPSATELGVLYAVGGGVPADTDQAERALRLAASKNFFSADCLLASVLLRKANGQNVGVAQEALQFAKRATNPLAPKDVQMTAERVLWEFYLRDAPPTLRDARRGVLHLQRAFSLGDAEAAVQLAKAYRVGLGVDRNLPRAYAFSLLAVERGRGDQAMRELAALAPIMTSEDVAAGKRLAADVDSLGEEHDWQSTAPTVKSFGRVAHTLN